MTNQERDLHLIDMAMDGDHDEKAAYFAHLTAHLVHLIYCGLGGEKLSESELNPWSGDLQVKAKPVSPDVMRAALMRRYEANRAKGQNGG